MSDDTLTMLADAAAAFAKPDAARVRALRGTADGFDRGIWQQMADLGWFAILVPEDAGGLGLNCTAAAAIATRVGYAAFPEPFVAAGAMVPWLLARCGANGAGPLAEVAGGRTIAALAWQGVDGAIDPTRVGARATPVAGGGARLDGTCRFVVPAGADAFVVAAQAAQGVSLHWVTRAQSGVAVRAEPLADGTSAGWLTLSGVEVPAGALLADTPAGAALLRDAVEIGTVLCSAELVGTMDRALELTLDYLRTRKQFGKPIGSFQALQHRAVDLWIHRQVARAVVDASIRTVDSPAATPSGRTLAASSAKARAAQAALLIANQSIQLHGAIGFTDEYDLGLYVNRALTQSAWMGNASEHRRRFGALSASPARAG